MRRAAQYLQEKKPELAIPEFEQVVAADPKNLNAQANLGVLLYFSGQLQQAEPHLAAALALDPKQGKLEMLLGSSEHRTGHLENARKDLTAALQDLQDPKLRRQTGLEIVEVDTARNDLQAASLVISQLKSEFPTDPEVLFAAYQIYTGLAEEAMLDLSVVAPDSAQMHQVMAHELMRAHDNSAAIANLQTALNADPHLPGARYELAQLLAASSAPEQKAEAKKQFELALVDNPNDDKSLTQLGDLAAAANDHTNAMADYRKALAIQPDNADAAIGLAHELVETNDLQAALPLLLQVLKADPTNLLAHYRLSVLYRRLHRLDDAKREVAEYERLKATHEKLRSVYQNLHNGSPMADDEKK